jgi:hypothetical protein
MIDLTEGSRMRTNASGSPKTQKPNIIPKGQMTNQTPCNYRTPYKPQIEYYDEQMVIVNGVSYTRTQPTPIVIQEDENTIVVAGVKYQKIEDPKPQTLYNALYEKGGMYSSVCDTVIEIVKEWMPNTRFEDGADYNIGWNDCLQHLEENLK